MKTDAAMVLERQKNLAPELKRRGVRVLPAGELFARLVTDHGFRPHLRVIRGHNHLTQVYAVNTGDESLSGPVLEFLRGQ
jgi:hypothetical protein